MAKTRPENVYHYTDGQALIAILQKRVLRASEPQFLNDSRELEVGRDLLLGSMLRRRSAIEAQESSGDAFDEEFDELSIIKEVTDFIAGLEDFDEHQDAVFVSCFCEEGDLLSQWRSYGLGGYSIGMTRDVLATEAFPLAPKQARPASPVPDGLELFKIVYDEAEIASLTEDLATGLINAARHRTPIPNKSIGAALRLLCKFKDSGFSEEKEWRLAYMRQAIHVQNNVAINYRPSPHTIVPYIEINVADAIDHIVVGPGGNQRLRVAAVKRMVNAYDIKATVEPSSVPYRG